MTSAAETTRISAAIARNHGRRWCSACQTDKPAEGFVLRNNHWRCAHCAAMSRVYKGGRK